LLKKISAEAAKFKSKNVSNLKYPLREACSVTSRPCEREADRTSKWGVERAEDQNGDYNIKE